MDWDDVVYLLLLFSSIGFGYIYPSLGANVAQRKWIGTATGLAVVLLVSGIHVIHSFITFAVNAAIILVFPKRICALVSFIFSFLYLFFFRSTEYFGIPYPPGHTNLIQMMLTLKLVGLAFEKKLNSDFKADIVELFHYTFNYIGVLTGPYYRYRTFEDYFENPYVNKVLDVRVKQTIHNLRFVPMYAVLFLAASAIWPLSYALSDEFYEERSWLYRFWYVWPNFFIFRMRIYIGLTLSECVCIMAGLGMYPTQMKSKPGLGPSNVTPIGDHTEEKSVTYDCVTINNVRPSGADFCTTYREGMRHWNTCIQYWLAVNVYQQFPSKRYRTIAVVVVSAMWHGVYTGYYVCICSVPFVLFIEDVYYKLFMKDKANKKEDQMTEDELKKSKELGRYFEKTGPEWGMWVFKMFAFSYFSIAFVMLDLNKIWRYYNSIYHAGVIIGVALYFLGIKLLNDKKRKEKKAITDSQTPKKSN